MHPPGNPQREHFGKEGTVAMRANCTDSFVTLQGDRLPVSTFFALATKPENPAWRHILGDFACSQAARNSVWMLSICVLSMWKPVRFAEAFGFSLGVVSVLGEGRPASRAV